MQAAVSVTQHGLKEFLLAVAPQRPVFVWGPPGIGKSAIIAEFARELGLECVSLLGSQLAPEDLLGVPMVKDGVTRFYPPAMIKRDREYCLFLDELNACSQEIQKAFYSLIHERRVGEYQLPAHSIVIGAGNRSQDSAIVKQLSSALINRVVHVHLTVSHREWLEWAGHAGIHPWVLEFIKNRPDYLAVKPPKTEEPFSTPRSWHMLSDCLHGIGDKPTSAQIEIAAFGCVSATHAVQFRAFVKLLNHKFGLATILKGEAEWPSKPEERDLLYFLAQSLRAHLLKTLPKEQGAAPGSEARELTFKAKGHVLQLASINFEIAQMVIARGDDGTDDMLPAWFLAEIARDLPRLVQRRS